MGQPALREMRQQFAGLQLLSGHSIFGCSPTAPKKLGISKRCSATTDEIIPLIVRVLDPLQTPPKLRRQNHRRSSGEKVDMMSAARIDSSKEPPRTRRWTRMKLTMTAEAFAAPGARRQEWDACRSCKHRVMFE